MSKAIERQIAKIYKQVFEKIFTANNVNASIKKKYTIEKTVLNFEKSKAFKKFCKEFSIKLTKKGLANQKRIWQKYFNAAKASGHIVLPSTYTAFEKAVLAKAIDTNFNMIKSIPQKVLNVFKQKAIQDLLEQVAEGTVGRKTFETFLKKKGAKNAKLIARTETAKLQTSIDRQRSTELGSIAYTWRASKDRRTRSSHKAMNDVIVFWHDNIDERPLLDKMNGDAGEFPNCRCTPLPIMRTSSLNKTSYKVYNFKTHKVVTMKKADLQHILETGNFAVL